MKCETTFFPFYNPNALLKKIISFLFLLKVFKIIYFQGKEEEYN